LPDIPHASSGGKGGGKGGREIMEYEVGGGGGGGMGGECHHIPHYLQMTNRDWLRVGSGGDLCLPPRPPPMHASTPHTYEQ